MPEPYEPNQLPLNCIDWAEHVSLIGKANASLARYDEILQASVNPEILISPLINREAVLSSRIEGTRASLEEVLVFEADPDGDVNPKKRDEIAEIVNYRKALRLAEKNLERKPLHVNMIKELHAVLLNNARGRYNEPGQLRTIQNYIARPGQPIEQAIFVPPYPFLVPDALSNWEQYLHSEEKDPLVQIAVLKAQFELIHPFRDGNGRIGRMLVPLIMYTKGLLSRPTFYISSYLEQNRDEYYQALLSISTEGDWNHWISFFLRAINEQAMENSQKAREILRLYEEMKTRVPEITRPQYAVSAIDTIFSRQIFKASDFVRISGIPKTSARRLLKGMSEEHIIEVIRKGRGRRATIYACIPLLQITG
ncbi:MAG: Fic family protein [Methanoculleus bourgensis]|jgi:Fic family protein|uniref:Fic family protein n=1 Tax=Methanoculleus bourgensis TaxID=83986 RepID=A0A0X3BLA0_9EURY|nr:Fic/DOC family N-terminal domain-containing protein [Methanoculleus bourgensis]NQS78992.1 Fic family protein [Methanoculleus bourgensis]CVK32926.1 Predicted cell division protein (Fic family) [Methanoculleus bourgensis]